MRRDLLVLLAQLLNLLPYRVERARCIVASGCEPLIAAHERREPLLELVEGERRSLLRVLLLLLLETLPLRHQLLETSALDLDRAAAPSRARRPRAPAACCAARRRRVRGPARARSTPDRAARARPGRLPHATGSRRSADRCPVDRRSGAARAPCGAAPTARAARSPRRSCNSCPARH